MKINKYILIFMAFGLLIFTACQDLVMEPDTKVDGVLVCNTPGYIDAYMVDLVADMPSGFNNPEFGWSFYANATDEAANANPTASVQNFSTGNLTAATGTLSNAWNKYYNSIYKANLFLQKTDQLTYDDFLPTAAALYRERLAYFRSEVRFLRALYYYELVRRYGGVVLLGDATATTYDELNDDEFDIGRSSFVECANYIISECDELIEAEALPLLDAGADQGRPNGTAVKALKCKTQLLLASPVYNTSITEGSSEQMNYWKAIAATAQDIAFDRIFSFGPYDVYDGTSPEVILGYRHKNTNQLERINFPIGCEGVNTSGSTNPTQNLVDAYRMKNGKKIDEPGSGYDPNNPYVNRDDRFEQTIIYNGREWNERNTEARTVEIFRGGRDGMDRAYGTKTGYYLKKYVNTTLDLRQGQGSNREWPIFRFADIILIWAEAVNEVWGPVDRGDSYLTATTILNQTIVRHGGLEELPLIGISKDELRERIREERFIELAFEGQRAWDLRRWGIASDVLSQPVYKMEVTKNANGAFNYVKQKLEDRHFEDRFNFYPIPQRDANNGLMQNVGW